MKIMHVICNKVNHSKDNTDINIACPWAFQFIFQNVLKRII